MTYVAWAALYEGHTDKLYFDVLIPKLMEDFIIRYGIRNSTVPEFPAIYLRRGSVEEIAREICESQDAFHIAFVHVDTGGRGQQTQVGVRGGLVPRAANLMCGWLEERCVVVAPTHEMEAWLLADHEAVCDTLGYSGRAHDLGLPTSPRDAERIDDPKGVLDEAVARARGRRGDIPPELLFPVVAQRQSLESLRRLNSFRRFHDDLAAALRSLGCIS